jgi:dienelactone hydrolase
VALESRIDRLADTNSFEQFHFSYAADAVQRVPGILIKPRGDIRRPVVIAMHGTGGNKEQNRPLMMRLAAKGFGAIAIDGRYHGERTRKGSGDAEYNEAILRAFNTTNEHPFFYDTAWDIMRLIDYLETRGDVDAKRIGLIGFSKGGIETYLATAADPRIAVAVPCIGVQSFGWALTNEMWQFRIETIQRAFTNAAASVKVSKPDQTFVRNFYDRVAPRIYDRFDGPTMLALIAPRPLLAINGDSDRRTPIPGLELCAASARDAYQRAGAKEEFVLRHSGKHRPQSHRGFAE